MFLYFLKIFIQRKISCSSSRNLSCLTSAFLGFRSKNTEYYRQHQRCRSSAEQNLMLREILFSHVIPHRTRESTYLVNYLSLVRWRKEIGVKSLSAKRVRHCTPFVRSSSIPVLTIRKSFYFRETKITFDE